MYDNYSCLQLFIYFIINILLSFNFSLPAKLKLRLATSYKGFFYSPTPPNLIVEVRRFESWMLQIPGGANQNYKAPSECPHI